MMSCSQPQTIGIDVSNLDTSVDPQEDFYQFATGGWQKRNPLPDDYATYGSFHMLRELNLRRLNELFEDISAKENSGVTKKIADVYNIALDSVKLNAQGYEPIKEKLEQLELLENIDDVLKFTADLNGDALFDYYVDADIMNSKANLFQIWQGGLSMGEREYYLDNDTATANIREKYKEHVARMFRACGYDNAEKKMEDVLTIETRLATASLPAEKLRDPSANYHKMSLARVDSEYPNIHIKDYLALIDCPTIDSLSVSQTDFLTEVNNILADTNIEALKSYLAWKVIDDAAPYLSDEFVEMDFDFYSKTMSGVEVNQPRWKRAVSTINSILGEAVGQIYVEKYFPQSSKDRMLDLIHRLQEAYALRLENLDWMSEGTKAYAIDKLRSFYIKVGYPDKWRDYTKLEIKDDSYYANIARAWRFKRDYMMEKVNRPVDPDEWYMTPQTVNAYYNPTTNEICFPAAILQPPFFDPEADDAFNFGAIGVVIGHEMTHGFDDQGRQFDKEGNLKDWWTAEDAEKFKAKAQVMSDFFDSISVLPDLKANGRLTLGENLADHGGLMIAYDAYKLSSGSKSLEEVDGYTPDQRFFLAYAGVWANNIRDEQIRVATKSDPHSLARYRVNGALPHIDAWYEAFGITDSSKMYVAKEERVRIW